MATGTGKVFKGEEFIADVQYDHRITREYIKGQTLDGSYSIPSGATVYLHISPPLPLGADLLTLHMADGKKQNFYTETPDGLCRATGGPY
jgi:hypothetical protein